MQKSFDDVWNDVQSALSELSSIRTLVQKGKNDIISIEKDHIKVKSEKTKKIRKIPRLQFERAWNSLVAKGFYISKNHQPYVHSQIICAILSLLNYVEARQNLLTLYLKEEGDEK